MYFIFFTSFLLPPHKKKGREEERKKERKGRRKEGRKEGRKERKKRKDVLWAESVMFPHNEGHITSNIW